MCWNWSPGPRSPGPKEPGSQGALAGGQPSPRTTRFTEKPLKTRRTSVCCHNQPKHSHTGSLSQRRNAARLACVACSLLSMWVAPALQRGPVDSSSSTPGQKLDGCPWVTTGAGFLRHRAHENTVSQGLLWPDSLECEDGYPTAPT